MSYYELSDEDEPFNAGIKSLSVTLPDESFLLGILLLEPCISLIYA
jgi:hypothetical protein